MKSILLICLTLLTKLSLSQDILKTKEFVAEYEKDAKTISAKIPFSAIIVKDYRYDSSKLGYVNRRRIVLPDNSSDYLTQSINQHYRGNLDPTSTKTLYVILKTFWLRDNKLDSSEAAGPIRSDQYFNYKQMGTCIVDFEIYAGTGESYKPLLRLRDDFSYTHYGRDRVWEFILLPFDSIITHFSKENVDAVLAKRKSFEWKSIDSAYQSRFDKKVLKETEMKKGVFLSFKDFQNNKPSDPDFVVKRGRLSDEVYINKGRDILAKFWGYCDGKDYYIRAGYNCFKLVRQNNTWDFFGSPYITKETQNQFNSGPTNAPNRGQTKIDYRPLQVNMETGDFY